MEVRKVLGQAFPRANTLFPLYSVPEDGSAVVSSLVVCNQSSDRSTFRISIAVEDVADANEQYIFYDVPVDGNRSYIATIGITLNEGDVIRCYGANGKTSFTLFGAENS